LQCDHWQRSEWAKTIGGRSRQWRGEEGLTGVEAEAAFSELDPNPLSNHEVVEHIHIKQLPGLPDLARHQDILGAGSRVARRMIVDDDQCRAIPTHGLFEHLTDAHY
jgi:hypothetical protein